MKVQEIYKHCLRCGAKLEKEDTSFVCTQCGFKHYLNPAPCNGAIIENEQGEILLVERKEDPAKGKWDVPGGFIEAYESLETSLQREVKEELGIDITVGDTIHIEADTYLFQDIELPTLAIISAARITGGTFKPADDVQSYKFFAKEDILKQDFAFKGVREALRKYLIVQ